MFFPVPKSPPPAADERVTGSPINGVFTATHNGFIGAGEGVNVLIIAGCKKNNGVKVGVEYVGFFGIALADLPGSTPKDIESVIKFFRFNDAGPPDCDDTIPVDLIITDVTKINNTGTALGGEISVQVIETKKP